MDPYWSGINNIRDFNRGLVNVSRDYYIDIAKYYLSRNMLDVGCGLGDTYNLFRKRGVNIEYTGIDIIENFIKVCERRYPSATFKICPAESIDFPDNHFEMVACRAVLEHLPDPEPALREMARVSNEIVVITWFLHPGPKQRLKLYKEGFWHNWYRRDKILEITESSGLRLEEELTVKRRRGGRKPHLVWVLEKM